MSIVFAVLFAISGGLHIWQNNLKYRSWRIGSLLPWAALLFTAGFCLREYGAYHVDNLPIYIASQVLIFCAPPVYTGADYFIFSRLLYYIPYLSPMHPGRVFTTFVGLDIIVEVLTGNGAANALNAKNTPAAKQAGLNLVKASLLLQLGLFAAFVLLVVIFHLRCRRDRVFTRPTKIVVYELYASSFFILLRNCFRTATFFYPYDAYINRSEWLLWIMEILPMFCNTYMMNIWAPAAYLPADHKIYLAKDGKTQLVGPGSVDSRPVVVTIFDPFDLVGLVTGKDRRNRFWEADGVSMTPAGERGTSTQ